MKKTILKYLIITCSCLLVALPIIAKTIISGKVTDTKGMPLRGVSVVVENSSDATVTNAKGEFEIESDDASGALTISFPGYKLVTSKFEQDQSEELVVLQPVNGDDGKEYVAYGEQSKEQVTGSVYSISGDDILSNRSTNLLIALQGRIPGLRVIQTGGEPGRESFDAHIRGYDSPNSNSIMYVVDGVERNPLSIDPYEVESVTVLKDGAATAMYGMRGSGGVLLITTKKGFNGESKISVSVDHAIQSPTRLPSIVSAYDYANMYNQRVANDTLYADRQDIYSGGTGLDHSGTVFYTPEEIEHYRSGDNKEFYPVRDMVGDFMKDFSQLTRVNVNFQGGSDVMRYFTSIGYMHQGGLFENEPFETYSYDAESKTNRFNFRTNLEMTVNENLEAWANIGGSMEKINGPHIGNNWGWDFVIAKLYETPNNAHNDLTPDGEVLVKRDKLNFRNTHSVYGYLNRTGSSNQTVTRLGNTFGARQKLNEIVEGLSATAQLSFDILSRSTQIRSRSYEAWEVATLSDVNGLDSLGFAKVPGTANSTLSDGQDRFFYYMYNMRASLDYQRLFYQKHSVVAKLMGERHMQQQQSFLSTNYLGLAGRLAYAYSNKYFAEANFAYQGSEQFAKGNRFGFFPSISAGWIISNEDFLEDNSKINYLKLRASVGQNGNSVYGYGGNNQYLYLSTWNRDATEDQIGNPNIKWETSTKYNLGIETEFFNSLFVGLDYFYHRNTDVILRDISIIPDGMMGLGGATLPPANVGETKNSGFELVMSYDRQVSKDLTFSLNGNVSVSKNEIIYMAELPYDETYAYAYRRQGYSINDRFGYKSDGLFNSQDEINNWADQSALGGVPIPGDIKYVDVNKDGVVDQKDRAPIAAGQAPDLVFGLRAQVNYKWVDLNVFLNGAANRDVYLNGFGRWSNRDNFTEYMKNAWTQDKAASGQEISYPRLGNNTTNYLLGDYWIEDGAYLRLRNVELGITLPENLTDRINASSVRFFVNGLNLFTWDKLPNDDFDPETADSSNLNYPIIKAYNFGVTVKF